MWEYRTTEARFPHVGVDRGTDANRNAPDGDGWELVSVGLLGSVCFYWWKRARLEPLDVASCDRRCS